MSSPTALSSNPSNLREQAQARFKHSGALTGTHASATTALRVLLELASSPDTAADALALLHELQVHQVELDLQAEELRTTRTELETILARQAQLHDAAPIAYCVVDEQTRLHTVNATAAQWLGNNRAALHGQRLDLFFQPSSRVALRDLLARVEQQHTTQSCALTWQSSDTVSHTVCASACPDPAGSGFLLVLCAMPEAPVVPA